MPLVFSLAAGISALNSPGLSIKDTIRANVLTVYHKPTLFRKLVVCVSVVPSIGCFLQFDPYGVSPALVTRYHDVSC